MKKIKIEDQLAGEKPIVERLDQEILDKIAADVLDSYKRDSDSRKEWEDRNAQGLELALQYAESKNFPWKNASNVKYPLITTACMQYNARAMPTLTNRGKPFGNKPVGYDPMGKKKAVAERRSKYLNYKFAQKGRWLDDQDVAQMVLPLAGNVYKKTYYSPSIEATRSELVLPQNLVKNYWAKDFEMARKSHVLYLSRNDVVERMRDGRWAKLSEEELDEAGAPKQAVTQPDDQQETSDKVHGKSASQPDDMTPFRVIEQHTFYDLDEDGYAEPVIFTVVEQLGKVVRIAPRYDQDGVKFNDKGEVVRIKPLEFFTEYTFIPSPDGSSMGIGLGMLLGPINAATNSILNQLINAGTLANLQSGFIGRGIRIRGGDYSLAPGQWKVVNSTGDDLKKNIFPLPIKEPSNVLFNLLGLLIQAGQDIGSTQDIMMGKTPGQNTPATTSMAALDQGLKVYAAIMRRQYSAQEREMQLIYQIEREYLDIEEYASVVDAYTMQPGQPGPDGQPGPPQPVPIPPEELAQDLQGPVDDVCPAADPDVVSDMQAMAKAEALAIRAQTRPDLYNAIEVEKRYLAGLGIDGAETLVHEPPPPQPDPQLEFEKQKWEDEKQLRVIDQELAATKLKADIAERAARTERTIAQAEAIGAETATGAAKYNSEAEMKRIEMIENAIQERKKLSQKDRELGIKERDIDAKAKAPSPDRA